MVRALSHPTKDIKYDIVADINPQLFHDVFQVVRQYLRSGDAVDLHDNYDNCKCYLSTDGLAGFAIEPDGNLVSVFSLGNGFLSTCGKYMIEQGAKKLDCFESKFQDLPSYYEHCLGFKVVSKLAFNYDIIKEDKGQEYADYFVEKYGEAKVMFMALTEKDIEYKDFGKDDYDLAVSHRDSVFQKCLGLTERYLLKSFKYIRREWKNGKWKYWYEEPDMGHIHEGNFGRFLTGFKGEPNKAFRHLFFSKTGQALDVAEFELPVVEYDKKLDKYVISDKKAVTGIDLVWGTNGRGIKHILHNHFLRKNDFNSIEDCERRISAVLKGLEKGRIKLKNITSERPDGTTSVDGIKRVLKLVAETSIGDKLVFDVEMQIVDGKELFRYFILTDYDNTRGARSKTIEDENEIERRNRLLNNRRY